MQGIKVLSAFGEIDEKYILEAEQPFVANRKIRLFDKKGPVGMRRHSARRWLGVAAGVCLALGLAAAARMTGKENRMIGKENVHMEEQLDDGIIQKFNTLDFANTKELQKLNPSGDFLGDLGTGCYTARKASELMDNPAGASEAVSEIETMPVYARKYGLILLSEEEIEEGEEYLREAAKRLCLDITEITRETNIQAGETQAVSLTAECEQGSMELDADGTLYAEGLNRVPKQEQEPEDFAAETANRLQCVSGFSKTKNFVWQSYDYDGEKNCEYYAYEEAGDLKEQIQNAALSRLQCYLEEDGSVNAFRLYHYRKNTVCLGEYPIIHRKKAEKLLRQGKYCSQYAESISKKAKVAACELTYVPETTSRILMPYYAFLVEVPGRKKDEASGLETFAKCYVPAVKEAYFSDSFEWNFTGD